MEQKTISLVARAHRRRLLEAMASSVALKGYAATTISDIVREAGVSRRTFYEQFATRSDCLIALYEAASERALTVLRSALDRQRPWQPQLDQVLEAYLDSLATNPALLRTLYVEIWGLGRLGCAPSCQPGHRRLHDDGHQRGGRSAKSEHRYGAGGCGWRQ